MLELFPYSLFAPLAAALLIGVGQLGGWLEGEAAEQPIARIALIGVSLPLLMALWALTQPAPGWLAGPTWLHSGDYRVGLDWMLNRLSLSLAALFALFCLIAVKFSVNYLHREPGYPRFFFVLSLFSAAMLLLVTAGNALMTFVGWEVAGLCSYLLIAYAYDRDTASRNATRAFVTNRIGDAGFAFGIGLMFIWLGAVDWATLAHGWAQLGDGQRLGLAWCFILAAMAKSAQVPLSPWLARAMEGPTPSSAVFYGAVMVHAGVYLLLRVQPLLESSPPALAIVFVLGLATALYGGFGSLVQSDVKSALIFATSAQIGLMLIECAVGLWDIVPWHLGAHAILRGYQFFNAPSLMHAVQGLEVRPPPAWLRNSRMLYVTTLQRFWLEPLGDWLGVEPIRRLAHDLRRFDDHVIDPLLGLPEPAMRALSSLAQWEERRIGRYDPADYAGVARAPGLLGRLTHNLAAALHRFEEHWVLHGVGEGLVRQGRQLGPVLNRLDHLLGQPRYAVLLMLAIVLTVL